MWYCSMAGVLEHAFSCLLALKLMPVMVAAHCVVMAGCYFDQHQPEMCGHINDLHAK